MNKGKETVVRENVESFSMEESLNELKKDCFNRYKKMPLVFGKWRVLENGDLDFDNESYTIYHGDLDKEDLLIHMSEKSFIDWNEFMPAYFHALGYSNIQKIEKMFYL